MGNSSPGKKCADRMGDSPPGKEGQRGSAMPKAENPAKRRGGSVGGSSRKKAGNRERKKKWRVVYAKHIRGKFCRRHKKFQKKFLEK